MTRPPRRVALTGGIATGKSYVAARLAGLGIPIIDADQLARDAVSPNSDALAALRRRFGESILLDGALNRPALARLVFTDEAARRDLEAIVHPVVYAAIERWFASLASTPGCASFAVADVPLLFETGHAADFDRVIVAACRHEQQVARMLARGYSADEARHRLAAQWPIADKVALADDVIDTSGSLAETDRQVEEYVRAQR